MTWIRVDVTLTQHPKVGRLSRALQCSRDEAVGVMVRVWSWSTAYAADGDLSRFESAELQDEIGYERAPLFGEMPLLEALTAAGFLDADMTLHDWHEHNGVMADRRRANAERMAERRAREAAKKTPPKPDAPDRAQHVRSTSAARAPATNVRTYERTNVRTDTRAAARTGDVVRLSEFIEPAVIGAATSEADLQGFKAALEAQRERADDDLKPKLEQQLASIDARLAAGDYAAEAAEKGSNDGEAT